MTQKKAFPIVSKPVSKDAWDAAATVSKCAWTADALDAADQVLAACVDNDPTNFERGLGDYGSIRVVSASRDEAGYVVAIKRSEGTHLSQTLALKA